MIVLELCSHSVLQVCVAHTKLMSGPPAPGSPGVASDCASWANPPSDDPASATGAFGARVITAMKRIITVYKSPNRFLQQKLSTISEQNEFQTWLWTTFPEDETLSYEHGKELSSVTEEDMATQPPLLLHPCVLNYSTKASLKLPCNRETFMDLVEHFINDGFVTASEPLRITQLDDDVEGLTTHWTDADSGKYQMLKPCSIGFTKGMSRTTTLFTMLLWAKEEGIDLAVQHPRLCILRFYLS